MVRGAPKGTTGHWANNPYIRRSVERDVSEFVGWKFLLSLVQEAEKTEYFKNGNAMFYAARETVEEQRKKLIRRDQALVAALMETGGRILEVLMLRKRNFEIEADNIYVTKMPIVKRYDKTDEILDIQTEKPTGDLSKHYHWSHIKDGWVRRRWKTVPRFEVRGTLLIRKFEPLTSYLESWIQETEDYLFPTAIDRKKKEPHISEQRAYQIVRDLGNRCGTHIWNHWFRSQRASQLASEYGFREQELDNYFGWKDRFTSKRYAKLATVRQEQLMTREKIRI